MDIYKYSAVSLALFALTANAEVFSPQAANAGAESSQKTTETMLFTAQSLAAEEPAFDQEATIATLQGEGPHSPFTDPDNNKFYSDEVFKVQGVITYLKASNGVMTRGFYIQDPQVDESSCASSGIFVYQNPYGLDLNVGDEVYVYAKVQEYYGLSQLTSVQGVVKTGVTSVIEPTPLLVKDCVVDGVSEQDNFEITLERYENMLVRFDELSHMKVARTFGFDYSDFRNNMTASHGTLNYHPNQKNVPGSDEAIAAAQANKMRRVIIESEDKAENGVLPWYPNFGKDDGTGTTADYIRVGATIDGMEGIVNYSYDEYRLFVTNTADASFFNHSGIERTARPDVKEADVKIGAFNVLNFFTSPFGGANNPLEQNRGAEKFADFETQGAKLASAMLAIDADIFSFLEVENNGYDAMSSIVTITQLLNAELPREKHYAVMRHSDSKIVGSDAISTKIIYRPSVVSLESVKIINMPEQHVHPRYWPTGVEASSAFQRASMTGTFTVNGSGERLILSTNHFKSKGSECWEDYDQETGELTDIDAQGYCENFRVSAAYHLGETLAELEGHKIILGDLNSYAKEDAIMLLTNTAPSGYPLKAARNTYVNGNELHGNGGAVLSDRYNYVDIIGQLHPDGFSYAYGDTVGNLDYTLISPSLVPHVIDATEWNINSRESTLFEYSTAYTGEFPKYRDPYRSSDHDPAILTLAFLDKHELGESIDLPTVPKDMPSENHPKQGDTFTAVVDLTQLGVTSLQIGETIQTIISDRNQYDVSTYSRSQIRVLNSSDIQRGWVSMPLINVGYGENLVSYFHNDSLISERSILVNEQDKTHGGSAAGYLMMMLVMVGFIRRRQA
ncbi:nuclease [Agarivorans sp. Toyoura001]|uniref:ExeM/NucH family extracellular endonuclease n=1 Tax=Agarivorans sp. Toyoura001 TaxID=2283141 RepID=UPI0010EB6335|nr:ExeM/NucH family extracellular endonuclease [Agarivorans sp. Toyoura001]GDY27995.1 nuclease [Agarivorans sp. Toyoura001]